MAQILVCSCASCVHHVSHIKHDMRALVQISSDFISNTRSAKSWEIIETGRDYYIIPSFQISVEEICYKTKILDKIHSNIRVRTRRLVCMRIE